MSKKSERPDTASCNHNWEARTGLESGTFKCLICGACGYRGAQMRVPYMHKLKGTPTADQARAKARSMQVMPYSCRTQVKTDKGRKMCKRPAYGMSGGCNLHAPLRPGETDE